MCAVAATAVVCYDYSTRVDFSVLQSLTLFSALTFSREVCAVNTLFLSFPLTVR